MSTACPEDDFFDIVEGLDLAEPPDTIVDYSTLNTPELLNQYTDVTQELLGLGETINPTTDVGRSLHSKRAAMVVELHRLNVS